MATREDELRGALARYLETDGLLGIRDVPLAVPAPRPAAPARPQSRASAPAPRPQAAESASPRRNPSTMPDKPVALVQNLSDQELARREAALNKLNQEKVAVCTRCGLSGTRTNTVFGQGHAGARLVFVGEAPGADEDAQGVAFIGRAGQLLTKMVEAMGLTRDKVFICNILKCRPPNNRDPAPDEVTSCWPYLDQQLQIIQPEVIVALGKPAAQTLLRSTEGIGRLRGRWHDYHVSGSPMMGPATPLMPTYHPAYLLRSPGEKGKAWSDLKMVMARLGLPVPK